MLFLVYLLNGQMQGGCSIRQLEAGRAQPVNTGGEQRQEIIMGREDGGIILWRIEKRIQDWVVKERLPRYFWLKVVGLIGWDCYHRPVVSYSRNHKIWIEDDLGKRLKSKRCVNGQRQEREHEAKCEKDPQSHPVLEKRRVIRQTNENYPSDYSLSSSNWKTVTGPPLPGGINLTDNEIAPLWPLCQLHL